MFLNVPSVDMALCISQRAEIDRLPQAIQTVATPVITMAHADCSTQLPLPNAQSP